MTANSAVQVDGQTIYTLLWEDTDGEYPIGYVLDRVAQEFKTVPESVAGKITVNDANRTLRVFPQGTEAERTKASDALSRYFMEKKTFKLLRGWRDELWPVYGRKGELLFSMERCAIGLLGVVRYGVHMNAYVEDPSAPHGIKVWVPKRAADKSTFPGMLDNTVAGGLMTGEDPFECIIREADEEASLPAEVVRSRAKALGTITYIYITDEENVGEAGFIYPECEWVYDLAIPADVIPKPKDGEVAEFMLCDVDEIKRDLAAGKYKTNCAAVLLDFFIRHGILTEKEEPHVQAIHNRLHRELPFPGPHQINWRSAE